MTPPTLNDTPERTAMQPFNLLDDPWIPALVEGERTGRDVSGREALTNAHRLSLPTSHGEHLAVLRMLAAMCDAACGPTTVEEWDAAWQAPTLDIAALNAYWDRWADRFDLFHPIYPFAQCAGLTEYARGPEALHPGSLGGDAGPWFNHDLLNPSPWAPGRAAELLLHLLAYDPAGIKRAAPGDPAGRASKIYGGQITPVASATHLHLSAPYGRLKDVLLLNLPPQPRTPGDTPVWERDTPPVPMRQRTPTGRLDLLTWPARRIRLHANADGMVDAVAHHDGDRPGDGWDLTQRLDPMSVWTKSRTGTTRPLPIYNGIGWPEAWKAARALDSTTGAETTSAVVQHVIAATERGVIDADLPLTATASEVSWSTTHRSTIADIAVVQAPMGTAGQWADPEARRTIAGMARYAGLVSERLRKHAAEIGRIPADRLVSRLTLADLDGPWRDAVHTSAFDLVKASSQWHNAVLEMSEDKINALPFRPVERAELLAVYSTPTASEKQPKKKPDAPKETAAAPKKTTAVRQEATVVAKQETDTPAPRRGRKATVYEVFGEQLTLSQLSQHPRCVVSYKTLARRVADGWSVEEAATLWRARGPEKQAE